MIRVLDTNVLLDRPIDEVILSYEPCQIVIPLAVIRELDNFKYSTNDLLRTNSRRASRYLDELRQLGRLDKGVELPTGHVLRIAIGEEGLPLDGTDAAIIMTADQLLRSGEEVVVVSQDINERLVADTMGIPAEDFGDSVDLDRLYTGWTTLGISADRLEQFNRDGSLRVKKRLIPNQFVVLQNESNSKQTMLARFNGECLVKLQYSSFRAYGISPANLEQRFFMELLMHPEIQLVTAAGPAGTGKTLLALAAGLEQLEGIGSMDIYKKMLITRSPISVGRELGYLPGDETEKLLPWMGAVFDSLEFLTSNYSTGKSGKTGNPQEVIRTSMDYGRVEFRAISYIRGRSIPQQFIIVDECQNMTRHEIKTMVSRAAEGTKLVLIGDTQQIDNHRLTAENNGLVNLIEAFKGQPVFGHITLSRSERSQLAELAGKLL